MEHSEDIDATEHVEESEPIEIEPVITPAQTPEIVWTLENLWRAAQRVSGSLLVPESIRGHADAVVAVMLTGRELGLAPMASLRVIDFIEGRPALSALGMRAVVQGHGHRITIVESTSEKATVSGERTDTYEEASVTWTIEDAKNAGLVQGKNGPKLDWSRFSKQMLVARATTELCRQLFSDLILGAAYSPDELSD